MNIGYSSWAFVVLVIFLLDTNVEAGTTPRDFSGDAMQRHNSQMMVSPMIRFPAVLGISPWPYINYPPAPSMTIVNVQVDIPHGEEPPYQQHPNLQPVPSFGLLDAVALSRLKRLRR